MSIVTLPANLPVMRQDFGLNSFDLAFSNDDTGSTQIAVFGPPRRTCALVSEDRIASMVEASLWRALVHSLDGQVNLLAVHDLMSPLPRGTARGGVWTANATAAGATTMSIHLGSDQAGRTLLQGDWLGVNQNSFNRQLLHVQADALADAQGLITVQFKPALRVALVAQSAIAWDRPTCLMRRTNTTNSWTSQQRTQGGFNLDLIESWEP